MRKLHRSLLSAAACALALGGTGPGLAKDKKEETPAIKAARDFNMIPILRPTAPMPAPRPRWSGEPCLTAPGGRSTAARC